MGSLEARQLRGWIFLYGPSGSGKTTVGRILAENLNLPFMDLDDVIETEAKMSIPEIFAWEGETGFRVREARALSAVIRGGESVLALGGGALTTPANRDLVQEKDTIVLLKAAVESLVSRLAADGAARPLLVGDSSARLRLYLAEREPHYASFPLSVDTTGKTPQEIAWEIQVTLGRYHLQGMAGQKHPGYDLRTVPAGLDFLGTMLTQQRLRGPVVVVSDENVGGHYLSRVRDSLTEAGFETGSVTIPPGENHKTLETLARLWDAYLHHKVERGSTVVALGGGVVEDLAGFAAATYLRGISWVSVPTSLLAMVDAGVGGKTGADLPQGKNLIGAFHPPRLVLVDPDVLSTLPASEFTNGMAEVVKHGVIGDPGLLQRCCRSFSQYMPGEIFGMLSRAMAVKVRMIEQDPYEEGIRAVLNYGHTVGHGVELASGFRLRHGEAVSIGMVMEARMAENIGLADRGLAGQIADLLEPLGLPVTIPPNLNRSRIIEAMRRDKKIAASRLKFALPLRIGEVRAGVEVQEWEKYIGDY
jgi:3-dehydroquinate synthase